RAIFAILPPPTPLRYPLSLHDALPISLRPPLAIDHDVTAASHHSTVLRPDSPHDDAPHESPECDGSATDQGWQSEPPLPVPWPITGISHLASRAAGLGQGQLYKQQPD